MNEQDVIHRAEAVIRRLDEVGRPAIDFPGTVRIAADAPLAQYFDHTLLKPDATKDRYEALCREARAYGVRSVCVPPDRVSLCAELLADSGVDVCTVIGFPLGYHSTTSKVGEVEMAAAAGAVEFDTVIPIGRLRDGDVEAVYDDVRAVVAAAPGRIVKVILETALLDDEEKIRAAAAALHAGAAMLKTSTGVVAGGATVEAVRVLRAVAGTSRGVKASAGVRSLAFARSCIAAGADRIGAGATTAILDEAAGRVGPSHDTGEGSY